MRGVRGVLRTRSQGAGDASLATPLIIARLLALWCDLAGEERDARTLVLTFDASVHGWAAVLRMSPDEPGIEVVGGSDCLGAISALRKGLFRSPALQNVALLHNRLFMDVSAAPPLYLHVPGVVMKAEGVCAPLRERVEPLSRRLRSGES